VRLCFFRSEVDSDQIFIRSLSGVGFQNITRWRADISSSTSSCGV
jgi:hypothetical protein